ncbi:hypothetical protein OS493_025684 [Desmophyllum pertusum]|uniref:Uncharacterized protein n=1 Tax=Desmophyllum pertusum TaxID=174260 RepID=A0A9W9ZLC6_9CNID|nr:hypothetical protein OS493_025684 [Desmophyllum pertusum]
MKFYCAAAVDNRSRLEFHGEPRIWDGHYIKRKIKGNSALYILTEEEQQRIEHIVRGLEQSTLKRSHDEVTTNERSDSSDQEAGEVFAVPGNPPKNITGYNYPIVVSGQARTDLEKSDINLHPTAQQDVLDKLPHMQGYVLCRPNVSTIHSISGARDVVTMANIIIATVPVTG